MFLFGYRVLHAKMEPFAGDLQENAEPDPADGILYAMFEAVLQEENEDHGGNADALRTAFDDKVDRQPLTEAKFFDFQVIVEVIDLHGQEHQRSGGVIEHIAHQVAELEDDLGRLG